MTSMYLKGKNEIFIKIIKDIYMFRNNEQNNTIRNAIWDDRSRNTD